VKVPFNHTTLVGRELEYIAEATRAMHVAGDGVFTAKCQTLLASLLGAPKVLLTTSCTHALELAALLLNIAPGDEVIAPSFTFVSTVNAFVLRGARPVFVDIRPDTLNLDETRLERLISARTRAILAVHYAGVGCEMDAVMAIARRHDIPVIEDNAHGLFGRYRGAPLGSFGLMSTLSFHETKNVTCGEGGALVLNDASLVERAEILREKGTNRSRLFRGEVDRYTWVDIGSSYLPSDILAAYLYAQLEARDRIQQHRQQRWQRYEAELADWARARGVRLPIVPDTCEQPFHLFYLLMPSLAERDAFIAYLGARDISAVFHYLPLHRSAMGQRYPDQPDACPVTEDVSDRLVRLPLSAGLTDADQSTVIDAIRAYA
jgi:dTDP-4-amino-4,6-dideoxygalactose transaminase